MAAMLNQSLCLCQQSARPSTFANSASPFFEPATSSSAPLPGARSRAASSRIPNVRNAVSSSADSTLARARYDGPSIVANVPRRSAPPLLGRSGRFAEMEGIGLGLRESEISQRVSAVKETKVTVMVDPVEAKRLAAMEMMAIQARAKLQRRKEIEAINGGWAMVGLTAGIVIDGYSGKSILTQIAGYIDVVTDYLSPLIPS